MKKSITCNVNAIYCMRVSAYLRRCSPQVWDDLGAMSLTAAAWGL